MLELHELIQEYSDAVASRDRARAHAIREAYKDNAQFMALADSLDDIRESLDGCYTEPFASPEAAPGVVPDRRQVVPVHKVIAPPEREEPVIGRGLARDPGTRGRTVARLYAVNTLGAVLGSLAAGFVLVGVTTGPSFGPNATLLACCDVVVAAEDASFCMSEVRLGIMPSVIGPYVTRAIGPRAARRYSKSQRSSLPTRSCVGTDNSSPPSGTRARSE